MITKNIAEMQKSREMDHKKNKKNHYMLKEKKKCFKIFDKLVMCNSAVAK